MISVTFNVASKRPLLMRNPASMQLASGGQAKRKTIPTPEEEAEASVYKLDNGQLFIPTEMFSASIRNAASGLKIGKINARTVFGAGLFFRNDVCPLVHPKTKKPIKVYAIDVRRAVVQYQGVLRARPRIDDWITTVECEYDDEILTEETILNVFSRAGLYMGVGDQRPSSPKKPGSFGTYTVSIAR